MMTPRDTANGDVEGPASPVTTDNVPIAPPKQPSACCVLGGCCSCVAAIVLLAYLGFVIWLHRMSDGNECFREYGRIVANVPAASVSYFGCGSFRHMQHEMVMGAESPIFGSNVTCIAGYAGGSEGSAYKGRVCYSAACISANVFGDAEVVSLEVSETDVEAVADYFFTSVCVNGTNQWEMGTSGRSIAGFPGGIGSPMGTAFKRVGESHGMRVVSGTGYDALAHRTVYVMDSNKFPFRQAEVDYQFHDEWGGQPSYSSDYHAMRDTLLSQGIIQHTGCPGDLGVELIAA